MPASPEKTSMSHPILTPSGLISIKPIVIKAAFVSLPLYKVVFQRLHSYSISFSSYSHLRYTSAYLRRSFLRPSSNFRYNLIIFLSLSVKQSSSSSGQKTGSYASCPGTRIFHRCISRRHITNCNPR